jgi:hypothetical protein
MVEKEDIVWTSECLSHPALVPGGKPELHQQLWNSSWCSTVASPEWGAPGIYKFPEAHIFLTDLQNLSPRTHDASIQQVK